MYQRSYDFSIVADNVEFRAANNGGDASLGDLSDEKLGQLVVALAQGLISERGLTSIAMAGIHLSVNGARAQSLMDEVRRRRLNFGQCALP